ncbi:MAG: hypothetical protein HUJ24_09010, partial [Rhodobacteraceae bacterium]|nr:hypothetical protein [Paracoccaceae bacterium]
MTVKARSDADPQAGEALTRLSGTLDVAIERLERARPFAKARYQGPVLDVIGRIVPQPGGLGVVRAREARMDPAG